MTQKPQLLLCDCAGSFRPDADVIAQATGLSCSRIATELCGSEAASAVEALKAGNCVIACGQQARTFADLAGDLGLDEPLCVDIRDRAGWSATPSPAKQAALLAEALLPAPAVPAMDVISEGVCLVYGHGDQALEAGARLAETLSVTVMLTGRDEILPPRAEMDIVSGRIARASGALGRFSLRIDGFAEPLPSGRGARRFAQPRDGAETACDLIVDISGGTPLFPAPHKRDGYLRADPNDKLAVERLLFDAAQLVGTFEKTLFIRFEESLCAHSRAEKTACTRCLDLCPTSAISSDGEHVSIDPHICAGCGACAAVCPTGAASADVPPVQFLFTRMRTLAETYRAAGGGTPRLLVHDAEGWEQISLAARFGEGLPGDVIPLEIASLNAFGHAEQLAALALGYAEVAILTSAHTETDPLLAQIELASQLAAPILAGATQPRLRLIETRDPDALTETLRSAAAPTGVAPILPLGGRRETARMAARALATAAPGGLPEAPLPLPKGAPYGAAVVDTDACTLCLACAGLCPTGALGDNPNAPELNFREEACVQCGLCANVCPEQAISLVPQMDLSDAALRPRVLNQEEPFACIECGTLFGVKSTIERITAKLSQHSMFVNSDNARLIQMCDDCRVRAQYHADAAPFQMGERPRVRTTDDDLAERENH